MVLSLRPTDRPADKPQDTPDMLAFQVLCVSLWSLSSYALGQQCSEIEQSVVLVKIGGSAITDKSTKETINAGAITWFSETISRSLLSERVDSCADPPLSYIIVHGAGSFGHHTAKEFGIKSETAPPDSAKQDRTAANAVVMGGLARTRHSVKALNHYIVESLLNSGVSAVGISPCFGIAGVQSHRGLDQNFIDVVNATLRAGLIPVLHGDACLHGEFGAGILGGDVLMEALGISSLPILKTVFVTDVPGIFSADPRKVADAVLISTINIDNEGRLCTTVNATGSSHEHDVTGGIAAKLGVAISIARAGNDVIVVESESKSAQQALSGKQHDVGTAIQRNDVCQAVRTRA